MSSQCASVNPGSPWPCPWSLIPQLRGWLLSRETMRSAEGEAAQGAGRGRGKRPVGRLRGSKN